MEVLKGARIPIHLFAALSEVEGECIKQAINVANLPVAFHHVALMPDTHVGYGMPVGGVAAIEGAIIPYAVGNDIGCGVCACSLGLRAADLDRAVLSRLLSEVANRVPVGPTSRRVPLESDLFDDAPESPVLLQHFERAVGQLGTLGSGNHFIEFQASEEGEVWVMIHSGSRHLGLQVCTHYSQAAKRERERDGTLAAIGDANLAWLRVGDGGSGDEYASEMSFCLRYAHENRRLMLRETLSAARAVLGRISPGEVVDVHHNYAALEKRFGTEVWVHRKGAVRAEKGQKVLVPGSMSTTSFVGEGLGLPEAFSSAAHGAGRRMGRGQSRRAFTHKQVAADLERLGIVHKASKSGLVEESAGAYKDVDRVMENQARLVRATIRLRPLAVLKG